MPVIIGPKGTRGTVSPFIVVANAHHGRSRRASTISPFPERTVRCLAETKGSRFQVVHRRNRTGVSVKVRAQIHCLRPPERFVCLRSALIVVAKFKTGGSETRSAIELVEDRLCNGRLISEVIILPMTEPEEKQSPARVVEAEAPTAFRWFAKPPSPAPQFPRRHRIDRCQAVRRDCSGSVLSLAQLW